MLSFERNETYLLLSLPLLFWGQPTAISLDQLKDQLKMNLTKRDMEACRALLLRVDLENARSFWIGNSDGPEGNYDADTLKTHLVDHEDLPSFFVQFLDTFPQNGDRVVHFKELLLGYYAYLKESPYPFIRFWGDLSERARDAIFRFRAKEPVEDELFQPLEHFFTDSSLKPSYIAEEINHFLFDRVHDYLGEDPFAIERVFAYIIQFYLIHLTLEVPS